MVATEPWVSDTHAGTQSRRDSFEHTTSLTVLQVVLSAEMDETYGRLFYGTLST